MLLHFDKEFLTKGFWACSVFECWQKWHHCQHYVLNIIYIDVGNINEPQSQFLTWGYLVVPKMSWRNVKTTYNRVPLVRCY